MAKFWRKNFDIRRVDMNIVSETLLGFIKEQRPTVGREIIKKGLWIIENLDNTGTYFPKDQLRELIRLTLNKILQNPDFIDGIHRKTILYNEKYFALAKEIRKIKLTKLPAAKLVKLHTELSKWQYLSHCYSLPTTWFLDSDGEDFTNYFLEFLRKRIEEKGINLGAASVFSILTTPKRGSLRQQEERESLKIVAWLGKNNKARSWFMGQTTAQIVEDFNTLPLAVQHRLESHCQKWRWTPYTYLGPAYGLDYYLEVWRGLLHEGINVFEELAKKEKQAAAVQKQRGILIKKLSLSNYEKHLFDIAADIIWLKGYRKDTYFHGFFVLDLILAEVARRAGLSLLQTKYLLPEELPQVLAGKNLADLANERMKFSVSYTNGKNFKVMVGKTARTFLKKQKFEKVVIKETNEFQGTCACPGKAVGIVKIVNLPEEMGKMNTGDIMVAHTTFPSLVPAMKKAAAIVTEDGGITCHAAIVARELQTPCVVGARNVLHGLKDGDKVEVDAESGVVRKIG